MSTCKKKFVLGLILIVTLAFLLPSPFMPAKAQAASAPTVSTLTATDVDDESATLNGRLTSNGSYDVVEYGFYYDDSSSVTTSDDNILAGTGDLDDEEAFDAALDSLDSDTRYYFRAYIIYEDASNDPHTVLATNTRYFTTNDGGSSSEDRPTVTTRSATDIGYRDATLNAEIDSIGGDDITEYGFYWGSSTSTSTKRKVGTDSIGDGDDYDYYLSGLSSDRKYYFKAYAKNRYGTDYGSMKSFTTDSRGNASEDRPNVTTKTPSVVDGYATLHGVLTSEGDSNINGYGFYWGTNSDPGNRIEVGYGDLNEDETFSYKLTGLTAGTTYYVKAYATNDSGTDYGSILSFNVSGSAQYPSIFTIGSYSYNINGSYRVGEVAPYIKNNRTYLPVRYAVWGMGIADYNILWDEMNQLVTLTKGATVVRLMINSPVMYVNGSSVIMDTAPEITNDRTCLPIAPIAQAFGYSATWDSFTQIVTIR
ncbi:MAG: stalk domain-containing protein [Firmicutes bacterium]|nr:stalk domain-containing protein [Bacillota bacterium]